MSIDTGADTGASTGPEKRARSGGAELIIPVIGVAFTLYYFTTIIDSPWTAQVSTFFSGAILILCSSVVGWRVWRDWRAGKKSLDFDTLVTPFDFINKRVVLLVLTVLYVPATHIAGFTLTTFGFLFLGVVLLRDGRNIGIAAALAGTLAVAGWALFVLAFDIRFPDGPFEMLMGRLR
jgi:hypothetical protein